jgi:hypothetical protein
VSLIDRAERLKTELTDKWVVVSATSPELKRFASLTGKVRTVNMNCRALVEFNNGVDIAWYDIDPGFLTVVDAPVAKPAASEKAEKPVKAAAPAAAAPAAGGGSAMDKIRAAAVKPAAAAAPAAAGSPLDKIRAAASKPAAAAPGGSPMDKIRAAAAKPAAVAEAVAEAAPAPAAPAAPAPAAPAPTAVPLTGSPLDRIRAQGAVKK